MPSKSQRAASRQARLSRRKRRGGKPALQTFQAGPTQRSEDAESDAETQAQPQPARAATAARPQPQTATLSAPPTAMRSRRRASQAGSPNVDRHLPRELRQIGIITTLIAAILTGLTFVLG